MKKTLSLLLAVSMVFTLSACGSSQSNSNNTDNKTTTATTTAETAADSKAPEEKKDAAGGKKSDKLTIYTCYPEDELVTIIEEFKKSSGIQIEYVRMSAGELYSRIVAEKDAPQASAILHISTEVYLNSMNDGLLYPYVSEEIKNVDPMFLLSDSVDNSAYNPVSTSPLCLVINTDWFESNGVTPPKTWEDLLSADLKGEFMMPHPTTSGIAYTTLSTIIQLYGEEKGWDYLKALNENVAQYTSTGSGTPTAISLGEAAVGISYICDAYKPVDQGYPVEVIVMDSPVGYDTCGVSILANGPEDELDNAKLFVDWCLSEEGQAALESTRRIPVNNNVVYNGITLKDVNAMDFDVLWSAENRNDLIATFTEKIDGASNLK